MKREKEADLRSAPRDQLEIDGGKSEYREVLGDLVVSDLNTVVMPFNPFVIYEFFKDMITQGLFEHGALRHLLNGLEQTSRQIVYPMFNPLFIRHVVDIRFYR